MSLVSKIADWSKDFLACTSIISYFVVPVVKLISFVTAPIDFSLVIIEAGEDETGRLQKVCIKLNNFSNFDIPIVRIEWDSNYLPYEKMFWPINKNANIIMKGHLLKSGEEAIWSFLKWYPDIQHDYSKNEQEIGINLYFKLGPFIPHRNFKTNDVYTVSDKKGKEIFDGLYVHTLPLKK